ncbi:MAG: hypothetical protein K6V97_13260 [Actinomycetia bacterium]|nr:hypothetical protein [Actinomycetes bacterium]
MSELRRRVAYLGALAERYDLAASGRTGRVLDEVIGVLREMALDLDETRAQQRELADYLDDIDQDLMCLEEALYTEDEEAAGDEAAPGVRGAEADGAGRAESRRRRSDMYIEIECPRCDQSSSYAEHLFHQEGIRLTCPHCGFVVFDGAADELVTPGQEEGGGESAEASDRDRTAVGVATRSVH